MKTSNIFDIKRFAVHDGFGIRTTIFFKGCPLRCKWCQNPEGLLPTPQIIYMRNQCIHCRLCEHAAYENQMAYFNEPHFNKTYTGTYDNLVETCPSAAIQYDSKPYTIEELLSIIQEDKVFYRQSGGVTLSGGEPLMQNDFLYDLLLACKRENIHTAIETSFYGQWSLIEKILPLLDQIYVDCKIYDEDKHKEATGVSNKIILDNISKLLQSSHKDKVIIRTPLIPEFTSDDENIKNISTFLYQLYPEVKYELLNYNPLASAKYELTDFTYGVDKTYKMYTKENMNHYYHILETSGIKNIIKE